MELIVFTLFATLFFLVFVLKISRRNKSRINLPPGPYKLPIIGNLYQLYGGLPHHILFELAKIYGPLMHVQFGEVSTIVVSSPEIAKEIFKTHDINFSQRPSNSVFNRLLSYDFRDIVFAPYGNYWRELRKVATVKMLCPKKVQSFRGIREEEVMNSIRSIFLLKGSCVNLSSIIFSLIFAITGRAAFGKKSEDQEKYIQLLDEFLAFGSGFQISDMYPSVEILQKITGMKRKLESAHDEMNRFLGNILREHKEKEKNILSTREEMKEDDLVDVLLNIQKTGDFGIPLTDNHLKAILSDVIIGGSDTSSTTVEWAMSETIRHPHIMKRVQYEVRNLYSDKGNVDESRLDELKYLKAIVKETLRLHPSGPLLVPRECKEQCKINGYDIPAKARLFINAWAIGRDPIYWKEPQKFHPKRFLDHNIEYTGTNFAYIPFGAGRRQCPGISFAEPNILLPLAQLLFHFDWKLPTEMKPEELDMDEGIGLVTRRKNELMVIPLLYSGSSLEEK